MALAALSRQVGPLSTLVRGTYYDGFYDSELGDPDLGYGSRVLFDAEVSMPLADNAVISLGANNLFNSYPDENPNSGDVGALYPESTPFGFNGGYYYLRLSYDWLWQTRVEGPRSRMSCRPRAFGTGLAAHHLLRSSP
ncbi:MAG: hypothetical protein OXQ94_14510 [Gemmatimonadota bacterium]|nr:hypothetical protein [Gemmatimonadota bacterium]